LIKKKKRPQEKKEKKQNAKKQKNSGRKREGKREDFSLRASAVGKTRRLERNRLIPKRSNASVL
jgi:hypothetical protein